MDQYTDYPLSNIHIYTHAGVMEIGVGGEEVEVNNPILQKLKDIEQRPRASTLETQDQGAAIAATVEGKEEEEQEEEQEQDMEEAPLSSNEVNVITGVLGLAKITIKDVMTPIDDVHMLSSDQEMDEKTIDCISKIGHSRLPVFRSNDRRHVIGVVSLYLGCIFSVLSLSYLMWRGALDLQLLCSYTIP